MLRPLNRTTTEPCVALGERKTFRLYQDRRVQLEERHHNRLSGISNRKCTGDPRCLSMFDFGNSNKIGPKNALLTNPSGHKFQFGISQSRKIERFSLRSALFPIIFDLKLLG